MQGAHMNWGAALGVPRLGWEELLLLGEVESMAGKAGMAVQKAHPLGLASSWV